MKKGWKISLERIRAGDLYVTSPLGHRYNLFGLHHYLRGDDGDGNFFIGRANIREAENLALRLADAVCAYSLFYKGIAEEPKLLTHTPCEQKKMAG